MTVNVKTYKDYAALRKAIGGIQKGGTNPHFKNTYVELNTAIDVIDEHIEDNNFICFLQSPFHKDGKNFLKTQLIHTSGDVIEGDLELITTKNDPQMMGSSITYMRRYGLLTILGLKAEDDDGNTGSGKPEKANNKDFDDAKARIDAAFDKFEFKQIKSKLMKEKTYSVKQLEALEEYYNACKAKNVKEEVKQDQKQPMTTDILNKSIDRIINDKVKPADALNKLQNKYTLTPEQEAAILQKQKMKG